MGFSGRCIGIYDFGGPEVLTTFDDVKSANGRERVVLRNRYSGVNPVDVSFRTGRMRDYVGDLAEGLVLGMECAGEVVASRSTRLPVGALVNALTLPGATPHSGSYAEYVTVDAGHASIVPDSLTPEVAAAVPLNGVTASSIIAVLGSARVVAITGAGGALGRFLVSSASAAGHLVVALARASDQSLLRRLGAERVYDTAELGSCSALNADVVIDAASLGPALDSWFDPVHTIVKTRADTKYTLQHSQLVEANVRIVTDVADRITEWNHKVSTHPEIIGETERFAPSRVSAGQARLAARHRRGRVVLCWGDRDI